MTIDKNRFNKIQIKTKFLFKIKGEFFRIFLKKTKPFFNLFMRKRLFFLISRALPGSFSRSAACTWWTQRGSTCTSTQSQKSEEGEIEFIYGIRDDDVVIIIFEEFATIDNHSFTKPRIFAFIFLFEKREFTEQSRRIRLIREMAVRFPILSVPL